MFDVRKKFAAFKYDISNKLVAAEMKNETGDVSVETFVGLKPKIDNNSEYKKEKGTSKNIVETKAHIEYKVVLLNKKCLMHSMNRIKNKDHKQELMKSTKFTCLALMMKDIP